MAEIIGAVASVAQLVQFSGALLAGGYGFLSKVARAPLEIRSLLTETAAMNSLLGQTQVVAESPIDPASQDALKSLERLGILEECRTLLEFIEKALVRCQQEADKDLQNMVKRLKWPFKEKETKDALERLHRLRGVLANAVGVDSAKTLRRIETGQGVLVDGMRTLSMKVQTQMSREETQKIVSWLCPLPTSGAHISLENALARHLPGTGQWFLKSRTFTDWLASRYSQESSSIWITGLPGSGKTLLCAATIEKILSFKSESKEDWAFLYFFCDHGDPAKITHDNFIMTLIRQMLDHSPVFLEQAKRIYDEKANNGDRIFNRADYIPLAQSFMNMCQHVFIFCDALDESSEGDAIAGTLSALLSYGRRCGIPTRVLFTSRFDVQLERRHPDITTNRVALAENMMTDIEQYVEKEMSNRVAKGTLKLRNKALQSSIYQQVASRAGTILQARLQLDYLSTARNDRDLKAMINNLPDGLEHTYETLLSHTSSQNPDRVDEIRLLLQCLVVAAPTLTAADLAEILAMEPGATDLDFDLVATDPYDALEVIAPFVILTNDKESKDVVKLSHYSLDEFLLSSRILQGPVSHYHVKEDEGHAWLALTCLQYLTFDVFNLSKFQMSRSVFPPLENYSLRRYAALNWMRHFKKAQNIVGFNERCRAHLDRLFADCEESSPCYRRWQEVYCQYYPYGELHEYSPICFAISQGLNDVVDDLLPHLNDINSSYVGDYTCLAIAAKWNQPSIVRKLLDLGADPDIASNRICTPLHLAAEFASREACDILLDAGADVHTRSLSESTPFYRACRGGDVHIVKRLKESGSDINAKTHDSWTPIMEAVENGHEAIVDLLLEWGADLTIRTDQGWNVLLIAEDGFNLAPNRSVIEKLKRAVPEGMYKQFLKEKIKGDEQTPDEWDNLKQFFDGKTDEEIIELSKPLGHAPPRSHPTPFWQRPVGNGSTSTLDSAFEKRHLGLKGHSKE